MAGQGTQGLIVERADRLFYERGFAATSFADIAAEVGISRGNFYHHFKTKDEILDAVIARRMEATRAKLDGWEADGADPAGRIKAFVGILIANGAQIMDHGCPVGTLCQELAKLDHGSMGRAAGIFGLFEGWLTAQFAALGCEGAEGLARHLLGRSQGIAVMANAYRDKEFLRREVDELNLWVDAQADAAGRAECLEG